MYLKKYSVGDANTFHLIDSHRASQLCTAVMQISLSVFVLVPLAFSIKPIYIIIAADIVCRKAPQPDELLLFDRIEAFQQLNGWSGCVVKTSTITLFYKLGDCISRYGNTSSFFRRIYRNGLLRLKFTVHLFCYQQM